MTACGCLTFERPPCLQLAQRRAAATGRLQVDDQEHKAHVQRLYTLVDSAVSYEHALYALCAQRVVVALRHATTSELQRQMPPGGAMNRAHENVFWESYICPPQSSVAACVPEVCASDMSSLAEKLAGIARHSNAVHGSLYQSALHQLVGGMSHQYNTAVVRSVPQRSSPRPDSGADDEL